MCECPGFSVVEGATLEAMIEAIHALPGGVALMAQMEEIANTISDNQIQVHSSLAGLEVGGCRVGKPR